MLWYFLEWSIPIRWVVHKLSSVRTTGSRPEIYKAWTTIRDFRDLNSLKPSIAPLNNTCKIKSNEYEETSVSS